jgi:hypothetical protein
VNLGRGKAIILALAGVLALWLPLFDAPAAQAQIALQKIPKPKPAPPRLTGVPVPKQVHAKLRPLPTDLEALVPFDMSPFPFDGEKPNEGIFLNIFAAGRRGHATGRGGTYWEDTTYNDRRVLLFMAKGFDVKKPAVMVVFFHGNGARLDRDVIARQRVPAQVAASGLNAVLVAPQFAVDALDSSAGSFWQPGTFRQFLDETAVHLVELYGDERTRKAFSTMPVVMVAYSGGYNPAAYSLSIGGADQRIKGVVLLDALYGEIPRFSDWVTKRRDGFFVSSYTASSAGGNAELRRILAARNIPLDTTLGPKISKGSVTLLQALPDAFHGDFVTHGFVDDPIKEVLLRLTEFAHKPGAVKSKYVPPLPSPDIVPIEDANGQPAP